MFVELVNFLGRKGYENMAAMSGIVREEVDKNWRIEFNPHTEDTELEGVKLPPFGALVSYNGFPVGIFGPSGGAIIAASDGSAEEDLIAALKAA